MKTLNVSLDNIHNSIVFENTFLNSDWNTLSITFKKSVLPFETYGGSCYIDRIENQSNKFIYKYFASVYRLLFFSFNLHLLWWVALLLRRNFNKAGLSSNFAVTSYFKWMGFDFLLFLFVIAIRQLEGSDSASLSLFSWPLHEVIHKVSTKRLRCISRFQTFRI